MSHWAGSGGDVRVSLTADLAWRRFRARDVLQYAGGGFSGGGEDVDQPGDPGREALQVALAGGGREAAEGDCGVGGAVLEEAAAGTAIAHGEEWAGGGGVAGGGVVLVGVDWAQGEANLRRGKSAGRREDRGKGERGKARR